MESPILYIVIPCYNEQEVLPITSKLFSNKIEQLTQQGKKQKGKTWKQQAKKQMLKQQMKKA